ncbi:hypothetical protein IPA_02925 [Ignicoccus pacificus DSM 13166]|uniref:Helicase ATP-binding domain-containing protein n=1 Tax=Ignicoccus pacificus DSM 13166 TaxID=940294 RepID=A0A977KAX9_9CREN|nr:hypothetical protein IPA_02925 [Ignicoccus pacificus DSM 13166]
MLRPWQRRFVEESVRALEEKRPAVIAIDSPTGSGKTLTALKIIEESLKRGLIRKAFFLVRTVTQVIPPVRDAERFTSLSISPLVGKERACPIGTSTVSLCKVCPWRDRIPPKPSSWVGLFDWIDEWKRRAHCPYMGLKAFSKDAEVIVMPSAYMNPSVFKVMGLDVEGALLIFDEAHNLFNFMREESLKPSFGVAMISQVPKIVRGLRELNKDLADELGSYGPLFQTLRTVLKATEVYRSVGKGVRVPEIKEVSGPELDMLGKVIDKVALVLAMESHPLFDLVEKLKSVMDFFLLAREPNTMVYMDGEYLRVKELRPWIGKYLEEGASGAVLMSGTMPSPEFLRRFLGRLDKYLSLLGDKELREEYFKLYRPENAKVIVVTDYTSRYKVRYDKDFVKRREMVERATMLLAKRLKGTALMVYPSYAMLKSVLVTLKVIAKELDVELIPSERGGGAAVLSRARKLRTCVIAAVAGDQITEGVELTENGKSLIKVVSIIGAPFPMPSAFLEDVAKSLDKDNYEKVLESMYEELMIMKVKQAIGRMIRSPQDKGLVILADYRFEEYLDRIVPYREVTKVTSEELLNAMLKAR